MANVSDEMATEVNPDDDAESAAASKKSEVTAKKSVVDHGVGLLHR